MLMSFSLSGRRKSPHSTIGTAFIKTSPCQKPLLKFLRILTAITNNINEEDKTRYTILYF